MYDVAEKALGGPEQLAALRLFERVPVAGPLLGLSTALLVPPFILLYYYYYHYYYYSLIITITITLDCQVFVRSP